MADAVQRKAKYIEGVGRRKRAVARVRITPEEKGFVVNQIPAESYFIGRYRDRVLAPLKTAHLLDKVGVTATVRGGGSTAQADAVRMGLARALVGVTLRSARSSRRRGILRETRARRSGANTVLRRRAAPHSSQKDRHSKSTTPSFESVVV
jgi:small subunit ribosomal protein S9